MPDILDIFVTKIPRNLHTQASNLIDHCSDHSPVMLSLDCLPPDKINASALSQFPTDWDKFNKILSEKTCLKLLLKTPSDIDNAVNLLITNIQTSMWDSAKIIPLHIKPPPHLPSYIQTPILRKRRDHVIWQRSRYPIDKFHYNVLTQKLKRLLTNLKSESYANYTSTLTGINGSLWKTRRKLLRIHNPPPILRNVDGSWALIEQSQADIFSNHFSNTFQPHDNIITITKIQEVESYLISPLPMYPPSRAFRPSEVEFILKKNSPKKAPGFDLISSEVVKPTYLNPYFADDKAILTTSPDPILASSYIQNHLNFLESWYKTWGVKINETKSMHGLFGFMGSNCGALPKLPTSTIFKDSNLKP
ncbi:hypothetical protein QTP88_019474 [Uroleucon formosanum]